MKTIRYTFLSFDMDQNSREWLRCSEFVLCVCLLSMSEYIASILRLNIRLAVSRLCKIAVRESVHAQV